MREEAVVSISLVGLALSLTCSSVTGVVAHAHTGTQTERWVLLPRRAKERQGEGWTLRSWRIACTSRCVTSSSSMHSIVSPTHTHPARAAALPAASASILICVFVTLPLCLVTCFVCRQTESPLALYAFGLRKTKAPAVTTPHTFLCLLIHTCLTSIHLDNLCRIHSSRDTHVVSTIECLL